MKSFLLDTNVLLWWQQDNKRLSKKARTIISNPENMIYVSTCSAWEVAIKLQKYADFSINGSLHELFLDSQFSLLQIEFSHLEALRKLPLIHQDPFDRLLIAQATVEKLTIITSDEKICQYPIKSLQV